MDEKMGESWQSATHIKRKEREQERLELAEKVRQRKKCLLDIRQ